MTAKTHTLKSWPSNFQAILDGIKTFDTRTNDRDFALGDVLFLREMDPGNTSLGLGGWYTDRSLATTIVYMEQGRWGLPDNLAVLGLGHISSEEEQS